jgi:hypothetical protein
MCYYSHRITLDQVDLALAMLNSQPSPSQASSSQILHRRGGQPGNQNARKNGTFSRLRPGPLSSIYAQVLYLSACLSDPAVSPVQVIEQACATRDMLDQPALSTHVGEIQVIELAVKLSAVIARAYSSLFPATRLANVLETLAQDPLFEFERAYRDFGITRDADSFFPVFPKSTFNSPLPAGHPELATNLTDSQ